MKQIAERAGVSVMTVSRALRGERWVKEDLAARIRAVAEEMGYEVNPLVQSVLSSVRRGTVAATTANLAWIIECDPSKMDVGNLHVLESAARSRALQLGFTLIPVRLAEDCPTNAKGIARVLHARGAAGAIIAPLARPGTLAAFPWNEFPCATIGRSLAMPNIHYTMAHYYHAMETVVEELSRRGYNRIGFLIGREMDMRSDHAAVMVFRERASRNRKAVRTVDGWERSELLAWIDDYQPDVIISALPDTHGLIPKNWVCRRTGVDFVTLSWNKSYSEWSGVRLPFAELASAAVDLTVGQIHRNERGIPSIRKAVLVEGEWVEGSSLRAPS